MQNAALFRRGVVLPLDDDAEEALLSNEVEMAIHLQHLPIPTEALFEALCGHVLFDEINRRCGTLVGDYEEEFVEASRITDLIGATKATSEREDGSLPDSTAFLHELHKLTTRALELDRPVLFVL